MVDRPGPFRPEYLAATGAQSIPPRGDATVNKTVVTTCAGGRLQVRDAAGGAAESIDFWVSCPPGRGGVP